MVNKLAEFFLRTKMEKRSPLTKELIKECREPFTEGFTAFYYHGK
jgi:hypothetical protein